MSNPYLSFLNSIGGSTGGHSTLQKLAASPSPSTSSTTRTTSATTSTTSLHRSHTSSSRPSTTAPRLPENPSSSSLSESKHSRHSSSSHSYSHSNSYSSSHLASQSHSYSRPSTSASKPRSSSSHHSPSYSNGTPSRDHKSYSTSNTNNNSSNYYSSNQGSSRNLDRADSKNYGEGQDRRHSNGNKSHVSSRDNSNHRDDRDGRTSRDGSSYSYTGSRNDRKRERDVDTGRSDDPRGYARTPKDKDASFSEPRVKKRHARSRSRTPSRTRSRSRSRSRSPSRIGTKYRQRSYSPRRRPTIKSRSKSRSTSRDRSPIPKQIVQDSKPTTPPSPSTSAEPVLPQPIPSAPSAPLPVATSTQLSTPPPPPPQQQQRPYLDLDDTSSFSTLSSPSSYSLSPPPRSAPASPTKDHSPIKKRRMESLLQAEASYSSPSSLSSLSPQPSDHSSPERELDGGEMSPSPAREPSANATAQDRPKRSTETPLKNESVSQQSLELELFGKILSKPKSKSTAIANSPTAASTTSSKKAENSSKSSSINVHRKPESTLERKPTSTSSTAKSKAVEDADEEEYGSLGSIVKDEPSHNKQTNGLSGSNAKRSSVDNVNTSREIVTINTERGTVTSKVVKVFQKPPKPSNGAPVQRTPKSSSSTNTTKESSQKQSSSSASGVASRRMSILHSDQIVAAAMGRYKNHFHMLVEDSDSTVASNPSSTGGDSMHVSVEYPGKDSREKFTLMKPFLSRSKTESDDKDEYNPIEDLVQTVRIIMEHFFTPEQYKELFGTANEGLYRGLTKYKNRKDGAQFLKAVEEFNRIMRKQKSLGAIQEHVRQYGHRLPYDLVVHLLQQVYSRTVAARASRLNQYEAFSNNVYGEILPILTKEFIQRTKIDETKVFVDLGCGIGNVVLQVALQTGAESYGVEIMDTPAKFAKKQAREFEARTRAFGLNHGAVSMIHGDFLETPGLAGILARADVVLVNNYAFNSALNQSLLQLFLDLKEGCKIISLKTFVSLDHKINVRNAGSVESILRVKKYPYYTNAVSWTHNGGEYFIATVDRSAVQAFWERAMGDGGASLDDGGSRRSSTRRR